MSDFLNPTIIGSILVIIGAIALVGGSLRVATLEINLRTSAGRITLIFAVLHILVGLVLIALAR